MSFDIKTYDNQKNGSCFFKALGHPYIYGALKKLVLELAQARSLGIFDPEGQAADFLALSNLSLPLQSYYFVQALERIDQPMHGMIPKFITNLQDVPVDVLFLPMFQPQRALLQISHLIPSGCKVITLEFLKLPDHMLTDTFKYLNPLNFATNYAFFREDHDHHTCLTTVNYWHRYGVVKAALWFCLFDEQGEILAQWQQDLLPSVHPVIIDSNEIKKRFRLPDFTGQLFIHALGARGHDIVKYALDTYSDDGTLLSATHDTNAWPCDYFAGLPAPEPEEKVILWIQNCHPVSIPRDAICLNVMGESKDIGLDQEIKPFATFPLDISDLFPHVHWPKQFEISAGKYLMRPRYEIIRYNQRRCIAHVNVERTDLKPDINVKALQPHMGKSFILPISILPLARYNCQVLPTPMAQTQTSLNLEAIIYASTGEELKRYHFGKLARNHAHCLNINNFLQGSQCLHQANSYGHMELSYDLEAGEKVDGWLHALIRYQDRVNGHQAETSFGSHIFNNLLTYRNEPQAYNGPAPGLSTRLYLRIGQGHVDTFCHLIYPISKEWHAWSSTTIELYDYDKLKVGERFIQIPASGSRLLRYRELFTEEERSKVKLPYIMIIDPTCRLFGYHGLIHPQGSFSLDHMFGF